MAPSKLKRVTKRQRRILRARLKHPDETQKEIGRRVGATRVAVARELNKPHVKAKMSEIMDAAGLTDDFIARKVRSLADAKTTKFFAHEGIVLDSREVDDNGTQLAAANLAADIKGHKRHKLDVTSNGNTIKSLLLDDGPEE